MTNASLSVTNSVGSYVQDHLDRVEDLLRLRFAEIERDWSMLSPIAAGIDDTPLDDHPTGDVDDLADSIDLPAALSRSTLAGGKRLRPTLSFLGFWASGGAVDSPQYGEVIKVGAALELLHSFALIHDDVMDESRSRRGLPTPHVSFARAHADRRAAGNSARFGENLAILLGDLAHAEADRLVATCPAGLRTHWYDMITELIRGQFGDLAGAADRSRAAADALLVARLKSGGYTVQRPLELGALAAGVDLPTMRRLSGYGREIGAAFALRDDLLGVWGDPAVTGKPAGDDLLAGKPTIIIALAEQRLPRSQQGLLDRIGRVDLDGDDIAALQGLIRDCGVEAEVEKMITGHVDQGLACLQGEGVLARNETSSDVIDDAPLAELTRLASRIAWRDR